MYWLEPTTAEPLAVSALSRLTMTGLIAAIIILGIYPQPILNALR
jgi:NADH:ubiquinone oxidoreductase subunit 4 (subunit M)